MVDLSFVDEDLAAANARAQLQADQESASPLQRHVVSAG
jgi:hypothetical protein